MAIENTIEFDPVQSQKITALQKENNEAIRRAQFAAATRKAARETPAQPVEPEQATTTNEQTKPSAKPGAKQEPEKQTATFPNPENSAEEIETAARAKALAALMQRYHLAGDKFYRKDGSTDPVFQDKGTKLTAPQPDTETARAMVDLAHAKGWKAIKVSGKKEFKAAVWLHAAAKGLNVDGYSPTDLDKVKLKELRDDVMKTLHTTQQRSDQSPQKVQTPPKQAAQSEQGPPTLPRHAAALTAMEKVLRMPTKENPQGHSAEQIEAALAHAKKQWTTDRVYVGKVLEHGPANYNHEKEGSPSYYVNLQNPEGGKFTVWGVDLRRALQESLHKATEDVVVWFKGSVTVEVPVSSVDPVTKQKSTTYEAVDRNTWQVEPLRTLTPEKAQQARAKAARETPDDKAVRLNVEKPKLVQKPTVKRKQAPSMSH